MLVIEDELKKYSAGLLQRPIWIVLTKIDLTDSNQLLSKLKSKYPERIVHGISSVTGVGIDSLKRDLNFYINSQRELMKTDEAASKTDGELRDRISSEVLENRLIKSQDPDRQEMTE